MVSPPGFNNFIINELYQDVQNFQGGNLRYFSKNWYKYTKDKYILDKITYGLKLNELSCQYRKSNYPLPNKEKEVISIEIKKLLKKKFIVRSTTEYKEFISGIFTRNKIDGTKRMILNVKNFNKLVNCKDFKMESINNVLNIIRPNVYMASIDLKDALFSVPIHPTHQKHLKFTFDDLLQFTCIPNGYGPAMRVFTKISKVPF